MSWLCYYWETLKETQAGLIPGKWRSWLLQICSLGWLILSLSHHLGKQHASCPGSPDHTLTKGMFYPFFLFSSWVFLLDVPLMEIVLNLFLKPTWFLPPRVKFNFLFVIIIGVLILLVSTSLCLHFVFLFFFPFSFLFHPLWHRVCLFYVFFSDLGVIYLIYKSISGHLYVFKYIFKTASSLMLKVKNIAPMFELYFCKMSNSPCFSTPLTTCQMLSSFLIS